MAKTYRIRVTKPDGARTLLFETYTSRKRAEQVANAWNKAQPTYKHTVIEE